MSDSQQTREPYILFQLKKTTYAIPSRQVEQMEMVEEFTPVPNSPPYVEGLAFVRGRVIPAINLRIRFGFPKIAYDLATRLVVVRSDQRSVGLIVDAAREFLSIEDDIIQAPPKGMSGLSGQYLKGVATLAQRPVLILDVDEIIRLAPNQVPSFPSVTESPNENDNNKTTRDVTISS